MDIIGSGVFKHMFYAARAVVKLLKAYGRIDMVRFLQTSAFVVFALEMSE